MSKISSQCDELRDWACELRKLANGPVNEGFPAREKLFESADAMCQAADTIWELRCKLAGVVDQSDEIERLKAENAKLREYAESYAKVVEGEGCGWCPYDMDALCDIETMPMRDGCKLYDELRKLGIEVEE